MVSACLRTLQKEAFVKILDNADKKILSKNTSELDVATTTGTSSLGPIVWKVLLLDATTQVMMGPLFKVNELYEHNITLFMQLESTSRTPIEDVAAVYFIQPSAANLERIRSDLSRNLYGYFSFHFTNPIPRPLLEELAQMSVQYGISRQILQVSDEYSEFICLEDDLFTLEKKNSFSLLNDSTVKEGEMQQILTAMADSLLSVCVSLDMTPPFIRFEKGTPSEALAVQFEAKLKEHFYNYPTRRSGSGVILILDRLADLPSALRHSWTYGGMIYDLFDVKLNQIRLKVFDDVLQKQVQKVFDIDDADTFWKSHHYKPFNQVAQELDAELKNYKIQAEKMSMHLTGEQDCHEEHAYGIKSALTIMPELEKRKRLLDIHMNLAMAILEEVQKRQIDKYYELEGLIMSSQKKQLPKETLVEWLKDIKGSVEDRARLLLIFYIKSQDISKEDLMNIFKEFGDESIVKALNFFVELKSHQNRIGLTGKPPSPLATSPRSNSSSFASKYTGDVSSSDFGAQLSSHLSTHYNYVGGVLGNIISNVKTSLTTDSTKDMAILKHIDLLSSMPFLEESLAVNNSGGASSGTSASQLMSSRKDPTVYQYGNMIQLDPLRKKGILLANEVLDQESTSKLVIFVMGGLNYEEYLNIKEFIVKKYPKVSLTIGATEILSCKDFLQQASLTCKSLDL